MSSIPARPETYGARLPKCCGKLSVQALLAFMLALIVILPTAHHRHLPVPFGDSFTYLTIAADLHDTGVFGDGNFRHMASVTGPHGEGMFFAPLYPAFLAALMHFDRGLYDMATCLKSPDTKAMQDCELHYRAVILAQGILGALAAMLVFLAAWIITDSRRTGWMAFALVLATGVYTYYAAIVMTEALTFPLFTLACLLSVHGAKTSSRPALFAAGIVWGLLCLNRPNFPYLIYCSLAAACLALGWAFLRKRPVRPLARMIILLMCGYMLATGPWIARNGLILHNYGISKGYSAFILAQRVAYNDMTGREWLASFVYGLPDFGDNMAKALFRPEDYRRFEYDAHEGFYATGNHTLLPRTLQEAGSVDGQTGYLIRHYVLGDLGKHILVTLSLAWRGMWVAKYWSLITIPVFAWVMLQAVRTKWWRFTAFAYPAWFMLGFNAFTSVNIVRYNLILLPCLAIGAAWAFSRLYDRMTGPKAEKPC